MPPLCPFGSSKSCGGHAWPLVSTSVVSNSLRADQLAWKDLIGWSSFRLGHHEMPEEVQEVSVQHGTQAEKKRSNDANLKTLKTLEEDPYFWSTVLSKRIILHQICWSHREVVYLDRTASILIPSCWVLILQVPQGQGKGSDFWMGVELSRQDCLHTASNPTGISLILYRECCIKYLKQSVYIDIYIQIFYTIPVFVLLVVRFKEVVLHIFHYQKLSCIFTSRFLSGGVDRWVLWSLGIMWRFTPAMALGWSSWGREMWSKVERHEIVTVDSGGSFGLSRVYDWKVAKIKQIFDSRCHGIFAAGQGSELKDVYDTWSFLGGIFTDLMCLGIKNPIFNIQDGFWKGLTVSCLAGEREVDHLFETTIKSPKGLWDVKCLAAAQNRSALAARPYI